MARGTTAHARRVTPRAGGGATTRAKALWLLLTAAGVPAERLAITPEGGRCPAQRADVPGIALGAIMAWIDHIGGAASEENAEELWRVLMVESDRITDHTFFWGDPRGGYWSAGAGLAARRWYGLPESPDGALNATGLAGAMQAALAEPRPPFVLALRHAPAETLAVCAGPVLIPTVDEHPDAAHINARCRASAAARSAVAAAQALAADADLPAVEREALVRAAADAPPLGVAPAAGASALIAEVAPQRSADGLPVLVPASPLGKLLADAVTAGLAHPEADRIADEARRAVGSADTLECLERQRALSARSPFHTRYGRERFARAARRGETRLRALAALAAGVDVPKAPRERLLTAA